MIKPQKLNPGDRIHVIAPSSPVRRELFEKGTQALRDLGFRVTHGDVFQSWRYLAGTDAHRRVEFERAFDDPDIKAIFFARGGYGCSRLLSSWTDPGSVPRILLGCSDITAIHLYYQRMHNWVVFHGPMPSGDFARGQVHLDSLKLALTQTGPYSLSPQIVETLQAGKAEGILLGGCLTLLHSALKTRWEPDWNDAILFLEDVSVKPYQIDRMLTHLKAIGKLDHVRAFVFGEMKDCVQVENQGYTLQEVILDLLGGLGKPIYFGFPSGHVSGLNWTLPLGVKARIAGGASFTLEILEGAVS